MTDQPLEKRLATLTPQAPRPELRGEILAALEPAKPMLRFPTHLRAAAALAILIVGASIIGRIQPETPAPMLAASLQPLCSASRIVERSSGEVKHVEGLGLVQAMHYKVVNQAVWASEDGQQVYAQQRPEHHTVFVALTYQ